MFSFFKKKHACFTIYVDGACWRNGKENAVSSYGLKCLETDYEESGSGEWQGKNTNNTGELMAIFKALKYSIDKTKKVRIFSDSQYAINSIFVWSLNPGKKNYGLIASCQSLLKNFNSVEYEWIKGHNMSKWNNYVDGLATAFLMENKKIK